MRPRQPVARRFIQFGKTQGQIDLRDAASLPTKDIHQAAPATPQAGQQAQGKKCSSHSTAAAIRPRSFASIRTGPNQSAARLTHAIDVINAILAFHQAMNIRLKARETGVELARKFQVAADGRLKRSPGIRSGIPGG
jgi:hypothetical protein